MTHPVLEQVTERVRQRSARTRATYLRQMDAAADDGVARASLSCSNLAHGMAACGATEKSRLSAESTPNIGIVTAYNDMLSAHAPYEDYPQQIRRTAERAGATAQVAGGVPAMCDGVTQGQAGMDLSLFSRDLIAMSTAIALSHNLFDAVLCLGICDKIVPGQLMGALRFGHLPVLFVPAGPMPSGLPNKEKAAVREAYAAGTVGRGELLAAESAAYHSRGTCTFYGTANSNQMLMEFMGLQLPGSSFVPPDTPLRSELTDAAVTQALANTALAGTERPLAQMLDERAILNAVIGLHATGGSTNHTLHLVAIAASAGIQLTWDDFADLSAIIPLLTRVYPSGQADVNEFDAAGGLAFVIRELLEAGLLHGDVDTVAGPGLERYTTRPAQADEGALSWQPVSTHSGDRSILRGTEDAFAPQGGLTVLDGNLGRAVVKISAVAPEHRVIEAPARTFNGQAAFVRAFEAEELNGDLVAVITRQGPKANGMPELHKLTPYLSILQKRGQKVALITDGRMSGASGSVLAAIHVTPEAISDGPIARLRDGDLIRIDANAGTMDTSVDLSGRNSNLSSTAEMHEYGLGRELFAGFRRGVGPAERGASQFANLLEEHA
ncbi:MAG: phosphogluconate dehydratase [Pseudomonadota bacterium]